MFGRFDVKEVTTRYFANSKAPPQARELLISNAQSTTRRSTVPTHSIAS